MFLIYSVLPNKHVAFISDIMFPDKRSYLVYSILRNKYVASISDIMFRDKRSYLNSLNFMFFVFLVL